jgi:hypothetical protein
VAVILFHGPGARAAALTEAARLGRLVAPPFGDEGFKVDAAREVVELLLSTPVGSHVGVVVVGPMDLAPAQSTDVLLKTLEEHDSTTTQPVLWAHDLAAVSKTVQSRCLARWADALVAEEADEEVLMAASNALEASLKRDRAQIVAALKSLPSGKERAFLAGFCEQLAPDIANPKARALWEALRPALLWRNPTLIEIAAVLLREAQ